MLQGKSSGEGLGGLPSHDETLGGPSSGFTLLVVFVYGDVNMTSVDFVNETKAQYLVHNNPMINLFQCQIHLEILC